MLVAVLVVAGGVLGATPAAADCSITSTLRVGSVGTEVSCLQSIVGATADGKFGPMTKASVMAWQAGHSLVADGVVGALTRAALMGAPTGNFPAGCTSASGYSSTTGVACNTGTSAGLPAGCSTTAGYSPLTGTKCDSSSTSTGPLTGGAGSITVDALSDLSSEEVGEGDNDVKVLAFEVEADDESDVDVTSLKVEFVQGTAADSENLDDYAESVSVWFKGDKVGEADVSDFSETSDIWTKTISLDGAVVRAGDTEEFEVAVTALGSIDSADIDTDAWTVDVLNVRFEDGEGVVTTEDTDAEALEKTFDFAALADSADLAFKITKDDEDVNDAHVINIDATDKTQDVSILSFEIEIEGDSDVNVDSLPVNITVGGAQNHVDEMVSGITLWMDGAKVGTIGMTTDCVEDGAGCVDVGTDETYVFDNLDLDLTAGKTYSFLLKVDIYGDTDTPGDVAPGDTILATFGETQTNLTGFDATDEAGDDLANGDMTGTATSSASEVRDVGMSVKLVGSPTAIISHVGDIVGSGAGDDDQGTMTITFDVTAFDGPIYIDGTIPALTGGGTATDLDIATTAGTPLLTAATLTSPSGATLTPTSTVNADARFEVLEGETERFMITAVVTPSTTADATVSVSVLNILYALTDVDGDITYTFNLTDFKSPDLYLNAN